MADIFISYSKRHAQLTEELARDLEAEGYTTWWDTSLLPDDVFFPQTIRAEIKAAKAVIVIWAEHSVTSPWVYSEATEGNEQNKLLQVRDRALDPRYVPMPFKSGNIPPVTEREKIFAALARKQIAPGGQKGGDRARTKAGAELKAGTEAVRERSSVKNSLKPETGGASPGELRPEARSRIAITVAAAALAAIAGLLFWYPWHGGKSTLPVLGTATSSSGLAPILLTPTDEKIDITLLSQFYEQRGDKLSVETVPDADGIAGRMTLSAKTLGANPNWVVFALSNPTDKLIMRWMTAQKYDIAGSRVLKPDLDAPRITNVTPSLGFRPERNEDYDHLDVYRLSIEPGTTVTYIVELASASVPRLFLSPPGSFGKHQGDLHLFHGILLGITGLLAVLLTAIFADSHKAVLGAAAFVAWASFAYLSVDFGFLHKLFQLTPEDNGACRAAAEGAFAASLVIFIYTYLDLRLWHNWISFAFFGWIAGQLGLIVISLADAQMAASLARLSFVPIMIVGSALITFLSLRGQERAQSLVPSWVLFMGWLFATAVTILGKVSSDIVASALPAGLVLFLALIAFTVTQYAFHTGGDEKTLLPG